MCLLCSMSSRECSFAKAKTIRDDGASPPIIVSSSSQAQVMSAKASPDDHSHATSDNNSSRAAHVITSLPSSSSCSPYSLSNHDSPCFASSNQNYSPSPSSHLLPPPSALALPPVDPVHMELLAHALLSKDLWCLGGNRTDDPVSLHHGLQAALAAPYLMDQVLAFSARHLASLRPAPAAAFYAHQAVALQTRAVSLFNAARPAADHPATCVPVLLFASVLGHHLLADMLAPRDDGLGAFLDRYVSFLDTHRGIYTIAIAAWHLLMETPFQDLLSRSRHFTSRAPTGAHCRPLHDLLARPECRLSDDERLACRGAVCFLQVGFDADDDDDDGDDSAYRYQMLFVWALCVEPALARLLAARRPEALVILAWYALLLHHGRAMWQVGGAGAYVLGLIDGHLGSEWDPWLEYPKAQVAKDQ